jgi:hypothetical protein
MAQQCFNLFLLLRAGRPIMVGGAFERSRVLVPLGLVGPQCLEALGALSAKIFLDSPSEMLYIVGIVRELLRPPAPAARVFRFAAAPPGDD